MDSLSLEQAEISSSKILVNIKYLINVKRKQIKAENITEKVYPLPIIISFELLILIAFEITFFYIELFLNSRRIRNK